MIRNKFIKKLPNSTTFKLLVVISLMLTIIQICMGTQVRQFVDGQIHYWGLESPTKWLAKAPFLFYFHRSFSLVVLLFHQSKKADVLSAGPRQCLQSCSRLLLLQQRPLSHFKGFNQFLSNFQPAKKRAVLSLLIMSYTDRVLFSIVGG